MWKIMKIAKHDSHIKEYISLIYLIIGLFAGNIKGRTFEHGTQQKLKVLREAMVS